MATGVGLAEHAAYCRWRVKGSKRFVTTFYFRALFDRRGFYVFFFIIVIESTITIIVDYIGNYYYYIDTSYVVLSYVSILVIMVRDVHDHTFSSLDCL